MKEAICSFLIMISAICICAHFIKQSDMAFKSRLEKLGLEKTEDSRIWVDEYGNKYYCKSGTVYKPDVIQKIGE